MPLVHDAIVALPCRHMLVILDSCFAGAFRWSGTRSVSALPAVIHQERYERFVRDPAWQVITSAAQDQEALDQLRNGTLGGRDGDGEHSPFALALFAHFTIWHAAITLLGNKAFLFDDTGTAFLM